MQRVVRVGAAVSTRAFSNAARAAIIAPSTNEAFIPLLTVEHAPTSDIFRVCLNTEPIVSRGNTFFPYGFRFNLPTESGEEVGQVTIEIDNTDLLLVDMLRRATAPPVCLIEVVLASNPNIVELTVADLVLREVSWNASTISGKLIQDDVLNQRFPKDVYDPVQFSGLY